MNSNSKIKILTPINIIGFILTMTAGWIDTVAITFFLKERSSFMSGRAASLGFWIFHGNGPACLYIAMIILAFIIGAYIATIISQKTGLSGGLFFTGALIAVAALIASTNLVDIFTMLIPMAMGAQNASTSLTSINRTTHLTGPSTDIGINIAKGQWNIVMFWLLRWIAFPLGAIIGLNLIHITSNNIFSPSISLIIPALIIIITAFILMLFVNIPLLNNTASGKKR